MSEDMPPKETMNERQRVQSVAYVEEDVIDLGEYYRILRANFWKIAGISLGIGILTLLYMLTKPNLYRASAVIMPVEEETRQSVARGALSSLGIQVGGPTKVEDLEVLFKSDDLTVRVFTRHDHWATILGDSYDPKTKTVKPGFFSFLSSSRKEQSPLTDWDAIRAADGRLAISTNRKMGTLSISFESPSAEGSASIVRQYLEEAKTRLQEEAFERASRNKKFIEEQIGKTVDALTRDRLYALYTQEVEREMLARNRDQFGFRIIDSPRVPDVKSRPARRRAAVIAALLSFLAAGFLFIRKEHRRPRE